jgi:uroporphyrinogen decarboxylase
VNSSRKPWSLPRPFEQIQFIRDTENVFLDLAEDRSEFTIAAIYPDLVEIGLDAVNSQLFCMDIEKLGREYAGKIIFWGEIDRQYLLPFGARAKIIAAVMRVKQALYCHGGVIAQCAFDVGAKPENVMQVFETWERLCQ